MFLFSVGVALFYKRVYCWHVTFKKCQGAYITTDVALTLVLVHRSA